MNWIFVPLLYFGENERRMVYSIQKSENILQQKSYVFAIRMVKLYKFLVSEKKEFGIAKQVLRAGTSIGANIEESMGGQSRKDFFAKICISYKEARETKFWIRLLKDSKIIEEGFAESLLED